MTDAPRTVLITGGSRGLGAGIVQSYLDSGDGVATCARKATPEIEAWLADQALADRFFFQSADLADRPDTESFVKALVERWDGIDVLVNNAGVARDGNISSIVGLSGYRVCRYTARRRRRWMRSPDRWRASWVRAGSPSTRWRRDIFAYRDESWTR